MTTIYLDDTRADEFRRDHLYKGDLFAYSHRPSIVQFCEFARDLIREAFDPLDPETAQYVLPVEWYAQILEKLKPAFIHHVQSKTYLQRILIEMGCDPDKTYFEVPKLRSSTSEGYLTTGIAYAWHPHRDIWYSAPPCQVNWWMPLYELDSENAMAFHPRYWGEPVKNTSSTYNYYQWNKLHRGPSVGSYIKKDPRPLPRATETLDLDPQLRLLCPVGGLFAFSAAQLHSSVPNTSGKTRFSIDFRTVHLDDVLAKRGAPNIDAACTGTTMREYLRVNDLTHIPDSAVALYEDGTESSGELVYTPASSSDT